MDRAKCVGIVVRSTKTYCRRIVDGIIAVSAQAGWKHVLVPADMPAAWGVLDSGAVDGVIGHFCEPALVEHVRASALPAVDISSVSSTSPLRRVMTDEVAVGRLAATYLLSLGLPRFAFIGCADEHSSQARLKGFEEILASADQICDTYLAENEILNPALPERFDDLSHWVRKLPTPIGVFASSDALGMQFLALCRRYNIAVPKEAAVLGVGNDDLLCSIANPPLSSIEPATERIGFDGATMLAHLMDGKPPAQRTMLIPPAGVITRQSSALCPILDYDVAAAVSYISLHARDHLRVIDVLRNISVSRASLDQRFRKALGRTPAGEIRRAQVELAKKALSQTQEQMPQVAVAAGFITAKQLTATFQRETGFTPSAYRKQFHRPAN